MMCQQEQLIDAFNELLAVCKAIQERHHRNMKALSEENDHMSDDLTVGLVLQLSKAIRNAESLVSHEPS